MAIHALCIAKLRHHRGMVSSTDDERKKKLWRQQGARLKEARSRAGFKTGSEAARALGHSIALYNQLENGTRSIFTAADDLAKRFGVSRDWLLTGEVDDTLENIRRALFELSDDDRSLAAAAALGAIEGLKNRGHERG